MSLYPNSPAVVAPASAADHNRVTCVLKPLTLVQAWLSRTVGEVCRYQGDTGHQLGDLCTKTKTLVQAWLAGFVGTSPQGSAPCLTVIEYDQEMHHTAKYKHMWREGGKGEPLKRLLTSSMLWSCASSLYTCIPRGWPSNYTIISKQRGHRPAPSKDTPHHKNKA